MKPRCRWIVKPIAAFDDFAETWDQLNAQLSNQPVLEARFIKLLLKHFGTGREKLAVLQKPSPGESALAATVAEPVGAGSWSSFQPSQAPLGPWLQHDSISISEAARQLMPDLSRQALLFSATQIDSAIMPRPSPAEAVETVDYINTAWVNLSGSFDDYWQNRGKNLRANMRKQRNRLSREAVDLDFRLVTTPEQMPQAVRQYAELESAGWKSQQGTAIKPGTVQGRFYTELLTEYAKTGNAVVFQLYYGEKLVASDLCIHNSDILVMLKTTYDEAQNSTSPAFLLHQEEFAYLFSYSRWSRLEFLGKLMDWHTKWSDEYRQLYHVNVFRHSAVKWAKSLRNRLRGHTTAAQRE